jgi:hypothetical protein
VKRYPICLTLGGLLVCISVLVGGCDCPPHSSVGPGDAPTQRDTPLTQIMIPSGPEVNDLGIAVTTWQAWDGAQHVCGPSPLGGFWTAQAAMAGLLDERADRPCSCVAALGGPPPAHPSCPCCPIPIGDAANLDVPCCLCYQH